MSASSLYTARARVAGLSRDRGPDDPELLAARADLAQAKREAEAERLAEALAKLIAEAPAPLSDAQRSRLAVLLRTGFAPSGGDAS